MDVSDASYGNGARVLSSTDSDRPDPRSRANAITDSDGPMSSTPVSVAKAADSTEGTYWRPTAAASRSDRYASGEGSTGGQIVASRLHCARAREPRAEVAADPCPLRVVGVAKPVNRRGFRRSEIVILVGIVNAYLVVQHRDSGYRGVDRDPWGALRDAHYQARLPQDLAGVLAELTPPSAGLFSPLLTRSRTRAHELSDASVALDGAAWDVIGIHSALLLAEGMPEWADNDLVSVGFDLVGAGEWSLLEALTGVQDVPELRDALRPLNARGLLPAQSLRDEFVEAYVHAEQAHLVEERAWDLPIDLVEVFDVIPAKLPESSDPGEVRVR